MNHRFRNIGFILIILVCAAGLVYFFTSELEDQHNILDSSLTLMGEKLFAMVPEGSGKDELRDFYQGFKQRAMDGLVPVEEVETVAANVLNASNSETELTSEQARGILSPAFLPRIASAPEPPSRSVGSAEPVLPKARSEPEKLEDLGKRMKTLFDFNEQVIASVAKQTADHRDIAKKIRFQAKNGLKLVMDAGLRKHLHEKDSERIARDLELLEHEKMLEWQEGFAAQMAEMAAKRAQEMKKLYESLDEQDTGEIPGLMTGLESLRILEQFEYIPVDVDSLISSIKAEIKESKGMKPRGQE